MKILKDKVRRLEKTGAFPLSERAHLPMRGRAFCDHANAATLEDEAKPIPNLVTDSTMETKPSPAVYEVTTIGSERYTVETWLEGAR